VEHPTEVEYLDQSLLCWNTEQSAGCDDPSEAFAAGDDPVKAFAAVGSLVLYMPSHGFKSFPSFENELLSWLACWFCSTPFHK
jgi:hypothetical protein